MLDRSPRISAWLVCSHMRHKDSLRSPGMAASSNEIYQFRTYHRPLPRLLGFFIDGDDAASSRRDSEAPVEHQTMKNGWVNTSSLGIDTTRKGGCRTSAKPIRIRVW